MRISVSMPTETSGMNLAKSLWFEAKEEEYRLVALGACKKAVKAPVRHLVALAVVADHASTNYLRKVQMQFFLKRALPTSKKSIILQRYRRPRRILPPGSTVLSRLCRSVVRIHGWNLMSVLLERPECFSILVGLRRRLQEREWMLPILNESAVKKKFVKLPQPSEALQWARIHPTSPWLQ